MRKFFGLIFMALMLFSFAGCGGGGSSGTVSSVANTLEYSSNGKTITGFVKIGAEDVVNTNDLIRKIELSDFYVVAQGCEIASATFSPEVLTFDSASGSIQQLDMEINFNSSCSDANVELHRTKTIYDTIQGVVQAPKSTAEFSLLPIANSTPNNSIQYALSTADNNVTISSSLEERSIDIYLYEIKNGFSTPVANKTVLANFVQPVFGSLKAYKAQTDENGKASFVYDAPSSIKDLNSTTLNFYLEDDNTLQSNIDLQFVESNANHVSKIYLVPKSVEVLTPNESHTIKIVTINDNNEPISASVNISSLVDGSGNDYGTLSTQNITTNTSGEGNLVYTSPDNLSAIYDTNKTITFTVNNSDGTKEQSELPILFKKPVVDENATDYEIGLSLDSSSIKIEDSANLLIRIYKKEDNATTIDSANVHNVTLISEFPDMLKFNINGIESDNTSYTEKAQNSLKVDSFTKAGIAIIKASATIFDGEKNVTIEQDFSYTIMSGPISSLSLVYVDTNYDNGLFSDHYVVHAIDKYGNPANKGEHIYAGVVNGLEFSSKDDTTPLSYDSIGTINSGDPATFSVNSADSEFGNVIVQKDRVIVLASDYRHDSSYLGGWSIQSVDTNTSLTLDKKYDGTSISDLSFVIGSEDRADTCGNTLALADLDSQDNSYAIGENGIADLTLRYDPYLIGKDVYMYVNAYTTEGRVGTPLKQKLYGKGITATDKTCTAVGDCSTTLSFTINERGGEALKNVAVPIKYEGSCQSISGKTVKVAVLGCTGTIYTEVNSTDADDPCVISWSGSIYYDSSAPPSTIYY